MDIARQPELLEQIVRTMNDGVVISQDGLIKYVNPAITHLVGYESGELVGESMLEFIAEDFQDRVEERHRLRLAGESTPEKYEIVVISKGGDRIPVEINVNQILFEGDPATFSLVRDITDRKDREETLQRKHDRLSEFASVVSHDLRNPLNIAKGRVELTMDQYGTEHLEEAKTALSHMETEPGLAEENRADAVETDGDGYPEDPSEFIG